MTRRRRSALTGEIDPTDHIKNTNGSYDTLIMSTSSAMLNLPTCSICLEAHALHNTVMIATDTVCHGCIRQIFHNAIGDESLYPPMFGTVMLRPSQYREAVPQDLRAAFREKEKEWKIAPSDRIYCACGEFLSERKDGGRLFLCGNCPCIICLSCGADATDHMLHACAALQVEDGGAFQGLERGKDYQICPNRRCKRKVELRDGCNHVSCVCKTQFCYICGEFAKNGSEHWLISSGCPRFGSKGSPRAIFDGGLDAQAPLDDVLRVPRWVPPVFAATGRRNAIAPPDHEVTHDNMFQPLQTVRHARLEEWIAAVIPADTVPGAQQLPQHPTPQNLAANNRGRLAAPRGPQARRLAQQDLGSRTIGALHQPRDRPTN